MLPPENEHLQQKIFRVWGIFYTSFSPFLLTSYELPTRVRREVSGKMSFHQGVSLNLKLKAAPYSPCPLKPSLPVV